MNLIQLTIISTTVGKNPLKGMEQPSQSTKAKLGANCGSDHELLIAKFRLKLKKVGKTARLHRYNLIKSLMIMSPM